MNKFVVIDGNNLINRAYYGLPMLKSVSGQPCGAIFGFLNAMLNLIKTEKPKYLACVFDAGKHTFRHDMYPEYKANRDRMPEDMYEQLVELKRILSMMNICCIEMPEIEADDIIGTITRTYDAEFIVFSGDKDLLQLINNNTTVWLNRKGLSDILKTDEETLKKEFNLTPKQVIELKSIMGDSSDNVQGVKGIGQVGAMKLIDSYGDLDNVYAHIDEITGVTKQKLIDGKDMAYLSKELVTIKLDVPINKDIETFAIHTPFSYESYLALRDLEFNSIINREGLFLRSSNEEPEEKKVVLEAKHVEILTREDFDNMVIALGDSFAMSIDDLMFVFAKDDNEYVLYRTGDFIKQILDKIKDLLSGGKQKICFDCKQIMHILDDYNIELNNYFDISVAIYIANEMDAEITIKDALKLNGMAEDYETLSLIRLKEIYLNKLINNFELKLYSDIELPLVKVLFAMEKQGIFIDTEQIKVLSNSYHEELDQITQDIYDMAGEEFNINSTKQLQTILFEKLKLNYKGKPSTSIEVLNSLKKEHPIIDLIIRYRKISKLVSTYLDGMLTYVKQDNKIHTTFMQRTTSTGRLSSREPNLQNLPIRDDEGRALRKMFASSFEGGSIISADYNQIELRLMANFSEDENMINDYKSGKDIHTATAAKIFNCPIEEVTKNMRRVAKSVNFGIIYGISAFGLSQNIGESVKAAGEFIKKYLEIYPRVNEYGNECIEYARKSGYSKTMMGRIRHIPDINSRNATVRGFAERVAKNMPLQGSASDIIKIAMIKVYNRLIKENLKSKLVIQIHDELIVDCYPGESERVKNILKQEMESVVDLTIPLTVELSEGRTLFEAK